MAYTKVTNTFVSNSTLSEPGGGVLQLSMDGAGAPRVIASLGDGSNLNSLTFIAKIDSYSLETDEWCGFGIIIKDTSDNHLFLGIHSRASTTLYSYALGKTWDANTLSGWHSNYAVASYSTAPFWLKVTVDPVNTAYTISTGTDGESWTQDESGSYSTVDCDNLADVGFGLHTMASIESDDAFSVQFSNIQLDYSLQSKSYDMSGGAICGGVAGITKTADAAMSGGVICGGAAAVTSSDMQSESYDMSGGAVCGGAAVAIKTANAIMSGGAVCGGAAVVIKTINLTMSGGAIGGGTAASTKIANVAMSGAAIGGGALTYDIVPGQIVGTVAYLFTLTGSTDGLDDIEIPITSLQARLRSGDPTYLKVVLPYSSSNAAAISARPNGDLEIDLALLVDGEYTHRETIISVNFEDVRIDQGPMSQSISLTGHKQETYGSQSITLINPIYKNSINGELRYRFAEPCVHLHPGDSVTVGDDTFNANVITYYCNARRGGVDTAMEIAES